MVGEKTIEGTVVEREFEGPPSLFGGGLYLRTEDGRMFRLIGKAVATPVSSDYLHTLSRAFFQDYLGQKVRVVGHRIHGTIWHAEIVDD